MQNMNPHNFQYPQIKRLSAFPNAKSPVNVDCEFEKVLKPFRLSPHGKA
jgi:hypothetical protein